MAFDVSITLAGEGNVLEIVPCLYLLSRLQPCVSHHSLLPIDRLSGWCDYVGRRRYIEDHHSIVFSDGYKYFGVFDGHHGSRAAKYSAKNLHTFFEMYLDTPTVLHNAISHTNRTPNLEILAAINGLDKWRLLQPMLVSLSSEEKVSQGVTVKSASQAMLRAFDSTNNNFVENTDEDERSGTTATVVVLYREHLLLRHVEPYSIKLFTNSITVMSVTHEQHSAAAFKVKLSNSLLITLPMTQLNGSALSERAERSRVAEITARCALMAIWRLRVQLAIREWLASVQLQTC